MNLTRKDTLDNTVNLKWRDCIECVSIAQILLCHEGPGHPVEAGGGEVQLLLLLILL